MNESGKVGGGKKWRRRSAIKKCRKRWGIKAEWGIDIVDKDEGWQDEDIKKDNVQKK